MITTYRDFLLTDDLMLEYRASPVDAREKPWELVTARFVRYMLDAHKEAGEGLEIFSDDTMPSLKKQYHDMTKCVAGQGLCCEALEGHVQNCDAYSFIHDGMSGKWHKAPTRFNSHPGFERFVMLRMKDALHDVTQSLPLHSPDAWRRLQQNKVPLYRSMRVGPDWLERLQQGKMSRLGIFWTYDQESAEPYWAPKNEYLVEIMLVASIDYRYVDWVMTYLMNSDQFGIPHEREVRLRKNTPLRLKKVFEVDREEYELEKAMTPVKLTRREFKA